MKRLFPRAALAPFIVLALAAPIRADFLWTYSTTPLTPTVAATTGSGSITLIGETSASAIGSTPIVIAGLTAQSMAAPATPDTFVNAPWQVSLAITDGGHTGSLTLSGVFNGTLSSGGVDLSRTFTGPVSQKVVVNGHSYTVTAGGFVPPSLADGVDAGGIGLGVEVKATVVPEPSSLLLCGLGAVGCAFAGWRRRSRQRSILAG